MRRLISTMLAVPEWLYGRRAAGLDLAPGLLSAAWFALMVGKPEMFDRGAFVGMSWLPDQDWIALMATIAVAHTIGMVRPRWTAVRVGASLVSAWAWIFVSASLWRVETTPGVIAYGIAGFGCLFAAVYLAGLPRDGF